jgi:hypothetical protein
VLLALLAFVVVPLHAVADPGRKILKLDTSNFLAISQVQEPGFASCVLFFKNDGVSNKQLIVSPCKSLHLLLPFT